MSESPPRLVCEDPDFARLVEASRHHEPSSKGFDETLSLVTRAAARGTWSSLRSSTTRIVAGVALVGASPSDRHDVERSTSTDLRCGEP